MPKKRKSFFGGFWDDDWFEGFFRDVMRDMQRMLKQFRELERAPAALPADVSGFSIRVFSNGKNPPKVEVQRFGSPPTARIRPVGEAEPVKIKIQEAAKPGRPQPRQFEEAPYTYHLDVRKVTIELQISGVEDPSNVDLNFQPESLEIRVYPPGSDKAYFAILKIPPNVAQDRAEVKVEKDRVLITIPRKHAVVEG